MEKHELGLLGMFIEIFITNLATLSQAKGNCWRHLKKNWKFLHSEKKIMKKKYISGIFNPNFLRVFWKKPS